MDQHCLYKTLFAYVTKRPREAETYLTTRPIDREGAVCVKPVVDTLRCVLRALQPSEIAIN